MYFNISYAGKGHQVCLIEVLNIAHNFKDKFIEYGFVHENKSKETKISG